MANDRPPAPKRVAGLYSIIALKLGKGLLLIGISLGVYSLLGDDLKAEFERLLRWMSIDPEQKFFASLGLRIEQITPDNIRWIAWGTLLYGLLLLVEGVGLTFRTFWAGWLAIGETAFFIPIEIYELLKGLSLTLSAILVINLVIVWYLARNRNRLFYHHVQAHPRPAD
jgi:uncharacterized membrane protein (DUF2068 family)